MSIRIFSALVIALIAVTSNAACPNSKFITDVVASGNAGALDMMVVVTSRFVYLEKPVAIVVEEVEFAYSPALKFIVKSYVLDVRYEKALQTDIVTRVSEVFRTEKIVRPSREPV